MQKKSRVCLLPVEVAGYQEGLEEGLTLLGWRARAITISHHPFAYSMRKPNPLWAELVCKSDNLISRVDAILGKLAIYLLALPLRAFGSIWVAIKFQIVVLNCGRSLLPLHADLLLYKLFGITIYAMMGHGSESRPPCMDCLGDSQESQNPREISRRCISRRRFVRRAEALSDYVISTPTIGHYLRKPFINGNDIGMPVSYQTNPSSKQFDEGAKMLNDGHKNLNRQTPLKIVHVPSNPKVKGSEKIDLVMKKLVAEGLVELRLLTGLQHSEVKSNLEWSDLLLDQLYSDLPLPVLASEAALLGVPTMIGSNDWEYIRKNYLPGEWPPGFHIHPNNLEDEIRKILKNPEILRTYSKEVQKFAEDRRSVRKIAALYQGIFLNNSGDFDQVRLVNPKTIDYRAGCGSSEEVLRELAPQIHEVGQECWKT